MARVGPGILFLRFFFTGPPEKSPQLILSGLFYVWEDARIWGH